MSAELYLSRLELKRDPQIAAIAATLLPTDEDEAIATDHRLMSSAFGGAPAGRVLWRRDDRGGRYLALSETQPPPETALFVAESKRFEPSLAPGDRLAFSLRLNATVDKKDSEGRSKRHDVAMNALREVPSGKRAPVRLERAEAAAREWLESRATGNGFALSALRLQGYRVARLPRRGAERAFIGLFDLEGVLEIADQAAFLDRLRKGFGRAKAFGCGLMLIRRAP